MIRPWYITNTLKEMKGNFYLLLSLQSFKLLVVKEKKKQQVHWLTEGDCIEFTK